MPPARSRSRTSRRSRRVSTRRSSNSTATTTGTRMTCLRGASSSSGPVRSGVQLAEELDAAGRSVVLSVGHCGRTLRRYRGRDSFWWIHEIADRGAAVGTPLAVDRGNGRPARPVRLQSACCPATPAATTRTSARWRPSGIRLAGRLEAADGQRVRFAPDLGGEPPLRRQRSSASASSRCSMPTSSGRASPPRRVRSARSTSIRRRSRSWIWPRKGSRRVLWTSGYRAAFGWIELPILDEIGSAATGWRRDGRARADLHRARPGWSTWARRTSSASPATPRRSSPAWAEPQGTITNVVAPKASHQRSCAERRVLEHRAPQGRRRLATDVRRRTHCGRGARRPSAGAVAGRRPAPANAGCARAASGRRRDPDPSRHRLQRPSPASGRSSQRTAASRRSSSDGRDRRRVDPLLARARRSGRARRAGWARSRDSTHWRRERCVVEHAELGQAPDRALDSSGR